MSIHKCVKCNIYTLKESCPKCKEATIKPAPARFSLVHEKKFGKYRRELMKRSAEKK